MITQRERAGVRVRPAILIFYPAGHEALTTPDLARAEAAEAAAKANNSYPDSHSLFAGYITTRVDQTSGRGRIPNLAVDEASCGQIVGD
ncbi:MAG TPA: hypothetical protein DCE44_21245 [Verrucomicrobiales bacterium]|nr:hypothetical protein [Verrucomicrobiales bacterium]